MTKIKHSKIVNYYHEFTQMRLTPGILHNNYNTVVVTSFLIEMSSDKES